MSEPTEKGPIAPALTPEEWTKREANLGPGTIHARNGYVDVGIGDGYYGNWGRDNVYELGALIALANYALPDNDPRKITHETVRLLRAAAASCLEDDYYIAAELGQILPFGGRAEALAAEYTAVADALASYLPPEPPETP